MDHIFVISINGKLHTAYAYLSDAKKVEAYLAKNHSDVSLTPIPMHWK